MKVRRILIALPIGGILVALSELFALPWEVSAVVAGVVAGVICLSLLDASLASFIVAVAVYVLPILVRASSTQGAKLLDIVSSASGFSTATLLGLAAIAFILVSVLTSLAVESAVSLVSRR